MQLENGTRPDTPWRRCRSSDRVMWVMPDRVLYVGLLGAPSMRTMGAIVIYVAIEGRVQFRVADGYWVAAELVVVQPYVPHQIGCDARHIATLYVEPETVDVARLPAMLQQPSGALDDAAFAHHVRSCHARLAAAGRRLEGAPGPTPDVVRHPRGMIDVAEPDLPVRHPDEFDPMIFGGSLAASTIDPRIAAVVDRIKRDPSAQAVAEECAADARLSFSRFLHLQAGNRRVVPEFSHLAARRSLLHYVHAGTNLTHVALDVGYPDSTHFSHSTATRSDRSTASRRRTSSPARESCG